MFLFCTWLSNDDVGVSMDTVFQEVRPEAGFKTGDFVEEKLGGGATVERLLCASPTNTYFGKKCKKNDSFYALGELHWSDNVRPIKSAKPVPWDDSGSITSRATLPP